jgi:hypothetical protein
MKVLMRGFSLEDAKGVAGKLKYRGALKEFVMGLNVELEHVDVTKGDLFLTGKIVLAHLKESSHYYSVGLKKGFFSKKELGLEA